MEAQLSGDLCGFSFSKNVVIGGAKYVSLSLKIYGRVLEHFVSVLKNGSISWSNKKGLKYFHKNVSYMK